jgi:hypothetical protein
VKFSLFIVLFQLFGITNIFSILNLLFPKSTACLMQDFAWLTLRFWWWRQYIFLKCQLTFTGLHVIISRKMERFTTTTVRTSNLIFARIFIYTLHATCLMRFDLCYIVHLNFHWTKQLGICRYTWKNDIEIYLIEDVTIFNSFTWLSTRASVNVVMNFPVQSTKADILTRWTVVCFSGRKFLQRLN